MSAASNAIFLPPSPPNSGGSHASNPPTVLCSRKSGRLRGALLVVAEVGRDDGVVAGDQQVAGRPGEAAEVAPVLRVRDQRAVEFVLLEACAGVVRSVVLMPASRSVARGSLLVAASGCGVSASTASTYPCTPSPTMVPLQTGREQRFVPERLALVHVRDVYLDGRQAAAGDGVAQGDAVVGVRAGVDDQAVGGGLLALEPIDEFAFAVRLERADLRAGWRPPAQSRCARHRPAWRCRRSPARACRACSDSGREAAVCASGHCSGAGAATGRNGPVPGRN